MRDTKIDFKIAEICNLPIEKRGNIDFVQYDNFLLPCGYVGGYRPTNNANQCLDALQLIFPEYKYESWIASAGIRYHRVSAKYQSKNDTKPVFHDSGAKQSFCEAACHLMLMSKDKLYA